MAMNAHEHAAGKTQRDERGAAVTDEGQGHAHHGQDAAHHTHVDEGIREDDERDAGGK